MSEPSSSAAFVRTDLAVTFSLAALLLRPSGMESKMESIGGRS